MTDIQTRIARRQNAARAKRIASGEPRVLSTHVKGAPSGAPYRKARALRNASKARCGYFV